MDLTYQGTKMDEIFRIHPYTLKKLSSLEFQRSNLCEIILFIQIKFANFMTKVFRFVREFFGRTLFPIFSLSIVIGTQKEITKLIVEKKLYIIFLFL